MFEMRHFAKVYRMFEGCKNSLNRRPVVSDGVSLLRWPVPIVPLVSSPYPPSFAKRVEKILNSMLSILDVICPYKAWFNSIVSLLQWLVPILLAKITILLPLALQTQGVCLTTRSCTRFVCFVISLSNALTTFCKDMTRNLEKKNDTISSICNSCIFSLANNSFDNFAANLDSELENLTSELRIRTHSLVSWEDILHRNR